MGEKCYVAEFLVEVRDPLQTPRVMEEIANIIKEKCQESVREASWMVASCKETLIIISAYLEDNVRLPGIESRIQMIGRIESTSTNEIVKILNIIATIIKEKFPSQAYTRISI